MNRRSRAGNPSGLIFKRNSKILEGAADVGLQITAVTDEEAAAAIFTNTPFPNRQIDLGAIAFNGEGGKDIEFGNGDGKVKFSASASAFAGMGVYPDPGKMVSLLQKAGLDEEIASKLNVRKLDAHNYLLLQWGYDIKGAVKGSVALGGVGPKVKFGVEAQRDALFAVVRKLDKQTGAATAIGELAASWRLPRQVDSIDDLAPGTWLIAEVDGEFAVKLGAQYGYDFNWVREAVALGGLTGDIGLRVELGVKATLGFSASGRYALLLDRESLDEASRVLRLRLYKMSKKGWDFAFNASATVQADFDKLAPGNFDEFIASVFNIHDLQVIKDLEKWTDPNASLPDLLGVELVEDAKRLLREVTGFDPETKFNEARGAFQNLLKKWHALPHDLTSTLYSIVERDRQVLDPFRDMLAKFAKSPANAAIAEVSQLLSRTDFYQTPFGKWLTAISINGVLTTLTDTAEMKRARELAKQTLEILDGSLVEKTLVGLQNYIGHHLRLDQIEKITATDFGQVDQWLKVRLSEFLGKQGGQLINFAELNKIRTVMHTLLEKREQFYQKAKDALTRRYEFEFAATYQKSTTKTAMLDIEFDFSRDDGPELRGMLRQAIDGVFDRVLLDTGPAGAVKLNRAQLTHEIKRQSHIEITLPYKKVDLDHINRSLAAVEAVDTDEGRMLLFSLDAKDIVTRRNVRDSRLAIGAQFDLSTTARVFDRERMTYSYSFRQSIAGMQRSHLQYQVKGLVTKYFANSFRQTGYDTWIGDLDTALEETLHNGKDNFGDTLLSLELSLPGSVIAAWKRAPADKHAPEYMALSRTLQARLRELIPFCYFQDPKKYKDLASAQALLVYSSLPVSTDIRRNANGTLQFNRPTGVFWDWVDESLRAEVIRDSHTINTLNAKLELVRDLLANTSGMQDRVQFYEPSEIGKMLDLATGTTGKNFLKSLLAVEVEVIKGAQSAGLKLAKFFASAGVKPTQAIESLAEFGETLTETFNSKISSIYRGDALRPLGTMVFIEAARALDPAAGAVSVNAMLNLIVLKENAEFLLPDFLKNKMPGAGDIARQERLVNLLTQ